MGIITQIKRNVRRKDRCSIYVDDQFFASCSIDVAAQLSLRKGLAVSDEIERTLKQEDRKIVLRQRAYTYATYKPRTVRQVQERLREHDATDEEIDTVVAWLESFGLVNDVIFAERFVSAARDVKPMSRAATVQALRKKGVPQAVIDNVVQNSLTDDDVELAARTVARKKWPLLRGEGVEEKCTKLARFLQGRGYPWTVVRTILTDARAGALLAFILCVVLSSARPLHAQQVTTCSRVKLWDGINRYQPTTLPVVSPDGRLFLDRKLHPDNAGGVTDPDEVWLCSPQPGGNWSEPTRATFTSVVRPEDVFCFTSDGLTALVAGYYEPQPSAPTLRLALLHRKRIDDVFTSVEVVSIPTVADLGRNFFAFLADDRTTLLLALDRSGGYGDLDLYVSKRCNGNWTAPVNLGATINTSLFEGSPWLAPDGRTLYFSSSGRDNRYGKADLYMSRSQDGSLTQWSTPQNLGACFNTAGDETTISLFANGAQAMIQSWDPETDRPALYSVVLPDEVRPLPFCVFRTRITEAQNDTLITQASISVVDTAQQCSARLVPTDAGTGTATTTLASGSRFFISTQARGYVRHHQVIGVRNLDSVTPLRVTTALFNENVPLASVYFSRGSSEVDSAMRVTLDSVVRTYELRQIDLRVVGYTDIVGTTSQNKSLSQERASAVADVLKQQGLTGDRLKVVGKGIENPGTLLHLRENPQSRRVDVFATESASAVDRYHR